MKKHIFLFALFLLAANASFAQVSITPDNAPPATSAMLDVQSATKGMLIPRMTAAQRTAIASPAVGLMVYQTDGTAGFYYYNGTTWNVLSAGNGGGTGTHYIGELYGGGIIFWLDNTGQHGLIASLTDLSTAAQWCPTYSPIGAVSTWDGPANTAMIAAISPAAQLCDDYVNSSVYGTGTFSDWYLPAIDELNLMNNARYILNRNIQLSGLVAQIIANSIYWSSTEYSYNYAFYFNFTTGNAYNYCLKSTSNWVRAVRAF
ncbi:MAG: DUF1566 domain-containing protein [Bacteroidetes bacterium]|nr:DUF1566 domain-containing protein [Bacteroidota bacterium]